MDPNEAVREKEFYKAVQSVVMDLIKMKNGRIDVATERATITGYWVGTGMIRLDLRMVDLNPVDGEEP